MEIIGVGAVFIVIIAAITFDYYRSNSILQRWADQNGYRIVQRERRAFFRGPFFWTTGHNRVVFYVTVEDAHGQQRNAWVRCGGWFLGLLSNNVDVRWD
jgi:hypothetical protein